LIAGTDAKQHLADATPLRRVCARCVISSATDARMRLAQDAGPTLRSDGRERRAFRVATARRRLRPHGAVAKGPLRSANPLIQKTATASDRTDRKNRGSFYFVGSGCCFPCAALHPLPQLRWSAPSYGGGVVSHRTAGVPPAHHLKIMSGRDARGPMTHDPSVRCADTSPTSLGRRRMRDARAASGPPCWHAGNSLSRFSRIACSGASKSLIQFPVMDRPTAMKALSCRLFRHSPPFLHRGIAVSSSAAAPSGETAIKPTGGQSPQATRLGVAIDIARFRASWVSFLILDANTGG
jgi:hypothetical protein